MCKYLIVLLLNTFSLCSLTSAQQKTEQWDRFELALKYSCPGNAFTDVQLSARFSNKDTSIVVYGFYDGDNTFKIRFMPIKIGTWNYTTSSNIAALTKKTGSFECVNASGVNHGMVKVSGTFHFKYADGKRYYPFGTTAYAWTHMGNELQEITLKTLEKSGFNKVRMCVFPKDYNLVQEEPEIYPFTVREVRKDADGKAVRVWNFDQFNPDFFQHLEKRIDDLKKLGIEADLILFHPYDKGRWGFDGMPNDVNIWYIKYLTSRLSSFRNVWWSMANEFDFVKSKSMADWDLLTKTVVKSDPYRHLCSIHGSTGTYYPYWKPELTHASIQDNAMVEDFGRAATLRNVYNKPIIYDEVNYEGNLKSRWGRLSGEQMVESFWQGAIAGTYVTHGETYWKGNATDTVFWAKGGPLIGSSPARIAFLRHLLGEGPGPLEMADISRDYQTATAGNGYYLIYFGKGMNETWLFNLPARNSNYQKPKPGTRYKVEVIDTWNMTIKTDPQIFETSAENDYRLYDKDLKKIRLPLKPYLALRITEIAK
jgi:hypothetical protein